MECHRRTKAFCRWVNIYFVIPIKHMDLGLLQVSMFMQNANYHNAIKKNVWYIPCIYRNRSPLVQEKFCRLICVNLTSDDQWTPRNKCPWNSNQNTTRLFQENAFKNVACKLVPIFFRPIVLTCFVWDISTVSEIAIPRESISRLDFAIMTAS